jgi:hypothetical protein
VKPKKEGVSFSADTVYTRLTEAGISMKLYPIDCGQRLWNTKVSREFMSDQWGGNMQASFPPIGKDKLPEHGLNDFMYLSDEFHPAAPRRPGAPGVWIDESAGNVDWEGIKRVFSKIQASPALWTYQGQYELRHARSLTTEEWDAMAPSVRPYRF